VSRLFICTWSHSDTPQSVGRLWTRDRSVAETSTWQHKHSQETNIHAPCGIRTHYPSKRSAVDLSLRWRGHWDRLFVHMPVVKTEEWAYLFCNGACYVFCQYCVFICMFVSRCVYMCASLCMHVYLRVCLCRLCVCLCLWVCLCCAHACVFVYWPVSVCISINRRIRVSVCVCVSIYTHLKLANFNVTL
jgi:hypothetical protein